MGHKLLLADDSITIQKVVGIIFANEDYDLTVVGNGTLAMEKARETVPDIVLVDALMPGKSGYEVCEEIRRDPALAHIPLLLMTGAFEPFDEDRARQSGADDYISKPFESQQLVDKVRNLIPLGSQRLQARPAAPPPAPPAPQAEVEAADIWGEVPAPPPAAPTAAAPAVAAAAVAAATAAAPTVAAPAAAPPEDFFTVTDEGDEDLFAAELTAADEVVEVAPGEDLWGAFEVDETAEEEPFAFQEIPEAAPLAAAAPPAAEDFFFGEPAKGQAEPVAGAEEFVPHWVPVAEETFSFEEEAPAVGAGGGFDEDLFGTVPTEELPGTETTGGFEVSAVEEPSFGSMADMPPVTAPPPVGEELFSFEEEEAFAPPQSALEAPVAAPFPGQFAPEEFVPEPQAAPPAVSVEQQFAPEEEFVPAFAPAAVAAAPLAPPAPGVPPVSFGEPAPFGTPVVPLSGGADAELSLSEEQLTSLLSKVSREIIEKIAWEVVPDLAETIIKEEIRKIKEGR